VVGLSGLAKQVLQPPDEIQLAHAILLSSLNLALLSTL
jgi:hypothetical protein